jgi:DNA-binding FadR family transcriptional regulator
MLLNIMDAHNTQFMNAHGADHERQADRLAFKAHQKLVTLLRAGDAAAAQTFWRKHLELVEKYMVGDSDTTLVELLS